MAGRSEKILSASRAVKEQYLKELLNRMNNGENITKKDLDLISQLESELAPAQPAVTNNLMVDAATVAAFFGVTIRSVQMWSRNRSCPKEKHGLYDLRRVFTWWKDNVAGADSKETETIKTDYWRWKAKAEKIRVQTLEAKLIPEAEIVQEWAARMSEVTTGLQALSRRIPPMIDGKSKAEQMQIIDTEIWKLRDNYCRNSKFCPLDDK